MCIFRPGGSSSSSTTGKKPARERLPCSLCPYVAASRESLAKHSSHHVLNPDAEFVCKNCPFYCTTKIELGIHLMVHVMKKRCLDASPAAVPEKKTKTEAQETPPRKERSEMGASSQKTPQSTPQGTALNLAPETGDAIPSDPGSRKKNRSIALQCDECPCVATSQRELEFHKAKHSPAPERPIKCDFCTFHATNKAAIKNHIRMHTNSKERLNTPERMTNTQEKPIKEPVKPMETEERTKREELMETEEQPKRKKPKKTEEQSKRVITPPPSPPAPEKKTPANTSSDYGRKTGKKRQEAECSLCPQTFTYKANIYKHLKYHTASPSRPLKCKYCSFSVSSIGSLKIHENLHGNTEQEMTEDVPEEETETGSDVLLDFTKIKEEAPDDYQEIVQPDEGRYKCNVCPYTTEKEADMEAHRTQHAPSKDRRICCDFCPFYVKSRRALAEHMQVHAVLPGLSIQIPSRSSTPEVDEQQPPLDPPAEEAGNYQLQSPVSSEFRPAETFYCEICPYSTVHPRLMKVHTEQHTPSADRQACCDYCPYYVKVRTALHRHMMVHLEYRQLKLQSEAGNAPGLHKDDPALDYEDSEGVGGPIRYCKLCPYTSVASHSLKRHVEFHSPDKDRQVRCPYCPYFVKCQPRLSNHMLVHRTPKGKDQKEAIISPASTEMISPLSKEEEFRCLVCPYVTSSREALEGHMKHHSPAGNHQSKCNYCPYYAKTVEQIERHAKLHWLQDGTSAEVQEKSPMKEDPEEKLWFVCTLCPYKTEYIARYKEHHHHHKSSPEWSFKCEVCLFYAATEEEVNEHMLLHPECTGRRDEHAAESQAAAELLEAEEEDDTSETSNDTTEVPNHHKCNLCPYVGQPNKLRRHQKMHVKTKDRQAKCPYCPFYVERAASLGRHLMIHTGKRPKQKEDKKEESASLEDDASRSDEETEETGEKQGKNGQKALKYQCSLCPYLGRKSDLDVHMTGHKPNPKNIYQCEMCTWSSSNKPSVAFHGKVHQLDYVMKQAAAFRLQLDPNQNNEALFLNNAAPPSPAKSDISDMSDCDVLEMASIKQQLITAKITSAPVSRDRFTLQTETPDDKSVMESVLVDKDGDMKLGWYKKLFKCKHCPFSDVDAEKLGKHEQLHKIPGKYRCVFCTYQTQHKVLRSRHIRVHAHQYVPGSHNINDYHCEPAEETGESDEDSNDGDEEMEVSFKDPPQEETQEADANPEKEKAKSENNQPAAAVKSPDGNSLRINSKPLLSMDEMPADVEYYVRRDAVSGENYLERASVKKWCCEKCPYATMNKNHFENHALLHASYQRNVCEYCDYSVPIYSFLLEHRKLHLRPNPNLLAMQSVTNLLSLPEVPADVAAAANFPGDSDDPISQFGTHDHMKLYENSAQYTEPRKLYDCDRCPYTSVHRSKLVAHMRLHVVRSELQCQFCDFSVSKPQHLAKHVQLHFVDPSNLILDHNHQPIVIANERPGDGNRTGSALNQGPKKNRSTRNAEKSAEEDEDLNNNSSTWICLYCERQFDESDRLERHQKQHLIGQQLN